MNKKKERRERILKKLLIQLEVGTKPLKINGKTTGEQVPLSETDKNRIQKEIETLQKRII